MNTSSLIFQTHQHSTVQVGLHKIIVFCNQIGKDRIRTEIQDSIELIEKSYEILYGKRQLNDLLLAHKHY